MAIYHCSISNISRSEGSSSCAALAYISASKVHEDRTNQNYSYGRSERVVCVETYVPDYAPAEFHDPAVLFNSIENYEKSENARTAKKIEVALPRELSAEKQKEILENYIEENFIKNGFCAVYAIHNDEYNNNPHAHILVPNRKIELNSGYWQKTKSKKVYVLDEKGEKIPLIDPNTGKQKVRIRQGKGEEKLWQRATVDQSLLDKKEFLENLRESWAVECNKYLSEHNQIDHRSYESQGVEKIPEIHEGYASREIEKRNPGTSDRVKINNQIKEYNMVISQLALKIKELHYRLSEWGEMVRDGANSLLSKIRNDDSDDMYSKKIKRKKSRDDVER